MHSLPNFHISAKTLPLLLLAVIVLVASGGTGSRAPGSLDRTELRQAHVEVFVHTFIGFAALFVRKPSQQSHRNLLEEEKSS